MVTLTTMSLDGDAELRRGLAKLLKRVEAGERVVILKEGRPVAEIRPAAAPGKRPVGLATGQIELSEDFDAPLPDDLLDALHGGGPAA